MSEVRFDFGDGSGLTIANTIQYTMSGEYRVTAFAEDESTGRVSFIRADKPVAGWVKCTLGMCALN